MRIERKRNICIFSFDFATRQSTGKVKQISLPLSVLIFSSQVDSCTFKSLFVRYLDKSGVRV